ncbi:alkaline shock response membrane anchor protein AmaP [Corynebacterium choanae]|uniref:Alkaline shock response membrane anchor protein AmaP n=1 Tax=Corynebacterium choanae TaxID=1862358 RepID=A0A3G6J8I1_9CORY|nr:alkaline shock response membrane anchor protein AmaP [Corynebacterium choanae]AZA14411.1 hypothetical protein CCHOA_10140 [Corynebacterium choanae]
MSRALAAVDRLIVLLVALGLAFLGGWSILYYLGNPYAIQLAEFNNQRIWREAPDQEWFKWVLLGIVIGGLLLGGWMVLANIRRKRIAQVNSDDASTAEGRIRFNITDIASAVAGQLERDPKVNKVKDVVLFDRGRPTMQFTISAEPDVPIAALRSQIDQAERDIREAIGTADIDSVYRIHLEPVAR